MANLKVITEANGDETIWYIADEKTVRDKLEDAITVYKFAEGPLADNVLTEYSLFVEYGAKDTPSFIFTKGNDEDWFIAQVEVKEKKIQ